jgi:hypothetical protein
MLLLPFLYLCLSSPFPLVNWPGAHQANLDFWAAAAHKPLEVAFCPTLSHYSNSTRYPDHFDRTVLENSMIQAIPEAERDAKLKWDDPKLSACQGAHQ